MSTGTIITIQPNGLVSKQRIENKKGWALVDMQRAVGGYIQRVRVRYDGRVRDAYVNEEGFYKDGRDNPTATKLLAQPYNFAGAGIVGPMAIWIPDPKKPKISNNPHVE